MCTLTLVRMAEAWRVVCSRDESPTRARAIPPREVRFGERAGLLPTDPQGGGTWIAVNDAGVVFALLNKSEPDVPAAGRESRGAIIPSLMWATSAEDAMRAAGEIDAARFRAFRLVTIDGKGLCVGVGDGARFVRAAVTPRVEAWCAASSGLGDELVEPARVRLFDEIVAGAADGFDAQDAFHRHRWEERPHMSVDMMRHGAQTVSVTAVTVMSRACEMVHIDKMSGMIDSARLTIAGVR